MSTPSVPRPRPHVELDRDPEPDELVDGAEVELPPVLERALEEPEADTLEQHLDVPFDEDEER